MTYQWSFLQKYRVATSLPKATSFGSSTAAVLLKGGITHVKTEVEWWACVRTLQVWYGIFLICDMKPARSRAFQTGQTPSRMLQGFQQLTNQTVMTQRNNNFYYASNYFCNFVSKLIIINYFYDNFFKYASIYASLFIDKYQWTSKLHFLTSFQCIL